MTNKDSKLKQFITQSGIYSEGDGDCIKVYFGEHGAEAELVGSNQLRMSLRTGIFATPETEPGVRAVCSYLSGWRYKIMNYRFTDEGELVLYYDRSFDGPESAQGMLRRMDATLQNEAAHLKKAADGAKPREAMGLGPRYDSSGFFSGESDSLAGVDASALSSLLSRLEALGD